MTEVILALPAILGLLILGVLIIALWWGWPIIAYVRARRRKSALPLSASFMLQFSLLSALWGALQLGAFGAFLGLLFPPYWLFSASFHLETARELNLPLGATTLTWLATGGVSAVLLVIGVKTKALDLAHVALVAPISMATLVSLWLMNSEVQTRIAKRATELGATCLETRSLWSSVRTAIYSPWAPRHSIAIVDGGFMAWRYRRNDFYPIDPGYRPKSKTDCPVPR